MKVVLQPDYYVRRVEQRTTGTELHICPLTAVYLTAHLDKLEDVVSDAYLMGGPYIDSADVSAWARGKFGNHYVTAFVNGFDGSCDDLETPDHRRGFWDGSVLRELYFPRALGAWIFHPEVGDKGLRPSGYTLYPNLDGR